MLLAIPILRYGHLPNYVTPYDWLANVERIIVSTGSIRDMVPIILNEWLLEIGYMDMAWGHGIAEWSLSLQPFEIFLVSLTGALIGLNLGLMLDRLEAAKSPMLGCLSAGSSGVLTTVGALFTGLTNATLFSIACCSTPSWVGSLCDPRRRDFFGVRAGALRKRRFDRSASSCSPLSALWLARGGHGRIAPRISSSKGAVAC